jgi:hypothetical protein
MTFIGGSFILFRTDPRMTYAETDAPPCRCGGVAPFGRYSIIEPTMVFPGQFTRLYWYTIVVVATGELERIRL